MNHAYRSAPALTLIAALLAGCAQPAATPIAEPSRPSRLVITPLVIDGRCTLVVSGSASADGAPIGHVALDIDEGIAQIDFVGSKPDSHSSSTFHIVVPVDEQHVDVIYIGKPHYPIWERAAGGKTCAS